MSDKIFQKRKAKSKNESKRIQRIREQYRIILIVCEGKKTEVNYFSKMIRDLDLPAAYVKVKGDVGSAPINVVNYAKEAYEDPLGIVGVDFINEVYCVVDRDSHDTFLEASNACESYKLKNSDDIFKFIYINPSFEYWLLLHYKYTDKPYYRKQKKSVSDCVIDDLKVYVPEYEKGLMCIYDIVSVNTGNAISNAERLNTYDVMDGIGKSCTNIHHLIRRLLDYRSA